MALVELGWALRSATSSPCTISSLYGLNAGIIDRTQLSLLVTVVVLSAIVPTAIAQALFSPIAHLEEGAAIPAEEYV